MSQSEVERVIGRAITDESFRKQLIDNAREACKEYDLTEEELDALEKLDAESMQAFAGTLDRRLSKKAGTGFV
nr:MAG: hypothetical protein DIU80_12970 [Chloroflexota bacterium]